MSVSVCVSTVCVCLLRVSIEEVWIYDLCVWETTEWGIMKIDQSTIFLSHTPLLLGSIGNMPYGLLSPHTHLLRLQLSLAHWQ